MDEQKEREAIPREPERQEPGDQFLSGLLRALGVFCGALGIFSGLTLLARAAKAEPTVDLETILVVATCFLAGLAVGGVLWAMATMLNVSNRMVRLLSGVEAQLNEQTDRTVTPKVEMPVAPTIKPQGPGELEPHLRQMTSLLRDLNESVLLDEPSRAVRRERVAQRDRKERFQRFHEALQAGEWGEAQRELDEMLMRYQDSPMVKEFEEQLKTARDEAEQRDVEATTRRVNDLVSIASWERAEEHARGLLEKHPSSEAAQGLLDRVHREKANYEAGQRRRLMAELERHTRRRQWRQALKVASDLIDRFPETPEADAVEVQMQTLHSNAEIEVRQELEERIKDLIKNKRFSQAVELAEKVIAQYPNSPQAEVLVGQLPRLRSRAEEAAGLRRGGAGGPA